MSRPVLRRPPAGVALIARAHAVVSGVILFYFCAAWMLLRHTPALEFTRATYVWGLGLCVVYLVAAILVFLGLPGGRALNYLCSVLYLARPPLGLRIWGIMRSPEFKAHFARSADGPKPVTESDR